MYSTGVPIKDETSETAQRVMFLDYFFDPGFSAFYTFLFCFQIIEKTLFERIEKYNLQIVISK